VAEEHPERGCAAVSVMEIPASNCVRSMTLMPARAGCVMVCICGIASISHTSSTSHQQERPTPYTFLQGLAGWALGLCIAIATGARTACRALARGSMAMVETTQAERQHISLRGSGLCGALARDFVES
jgi:hypothetical protein